MDLERDDLQGADDLAVKADERRMEMRRGKIIAVSLTVCAVGAGMTVNAYAASTTFEMRKKAVSLLGIITTSNYQANVTRGEFAELLVKASDYKEAANAAGTVSVFADVSSKSQYSAAIRTAATNSWMAGYLGGNFKPDEGCHQGSPGSLRIHKRGFLRKSSGEPPCEVQVPVPGFWDLS